MQVLWLFHCEEILIAKGWLLAVWRRNTYVSPSKCHCTHSQSRHFQSAVWGKKVVLNLWSFLFFSHCVRRIHNLRVYFWEALPKVKLKRIFSSEQTSSLRIEYLWQTGHRHNYRFAYKDNISAQYMEQQWKCSKGFLLDCGWKCYRLADSSLTRMQSVWILFCSDRNFYFQKISSQFLTGAWSFILWVGGGVCSTLTLQVSYSNNRKKMCKKSRSLQQLWLQSWNKDAKKENMVRILPGHVWQLTMNRHDDSTFSVAPGFGESNPDRCGFTSRARECLGRRTAEPRS